MSNSSLGAPFSPTLLTLARDLEAGRTTSRILVEECLARIAAPGADDAAFISINEHNSRRAADAMDTLRAAGAAPSPYAGIPLAIKDLFDVAGEVTAAGSRALAASAPAATDSPAVARLRAAGFIHIGRSNMTEFAYSGLGMNPHYGNPRSPWRFADGHVAGGSTSGGASAVAFGMAHAALGTDTGGSCRIPAAFCGLTGFKPTSRRIPRGGAIPLSTSLDSVGPIGRSVDCCAALDAILSGDDDTVFPPTVSLAGLRLAVPETVSLDDVMPEVMRPFERSLAMLSDAGATITRVVFTPFARVAAINAKGGFTAAESYAWHRGLLAEKHHAYDPRVSMRIQRGASLSAADYLEMLSERQTLIEEAHRLLEPWDALLMPTAPITPPRIADLATSASWLTARDDALFGRMNLLALRNPTLINMIDGCAISIPMQAPDEAPAGLMVAGGAMNDRRILAIARSMEIILSNAWR